MQAGQQLETGTRLGEYRIEAVLGQGGFGITYSAYDTYLDKRVAIKEYLPRDSAMRVDANTVVARSEDDREVYDWGLTRFLDEARTLARFEHRNLNRVHRFFEAHGTAYLVLDYIDGEPLSARLAREGALPAADVERLLLEMTAALEEVHRAGYVHRDIKPGNILLRGDGSAVLADFGAARQSVGGRTRSIMAVLTPGYAPIEQYDAHGTDIGPWTDLYALGMVAWRCVTGSTDSELVEANTRTRRVMRDQPDELPPAVDAARRGYPRALLEAIDWAIAVDEGSRPQDAAQWRRALLGEPGEAPRGAAEPAAGADGERSGQAGDAGLPGESPSASRGSPARRRGRKVAFAGVAAVVLAALAAGTLLLDSKSGALVVETDMEEITLTGSAMLFWGGVVGLLAKRKNRNPYGWGLAGGSFSLLTLVLLAFMPNLCPKCGQKMPSQDAKQNACANCQGLGPVRPGAGA